jgi:hypothetical protein
MAKQPMKMVFPRNLDFIVHNLSSIGSPFYKAAYAVILRGDTVFIIQPMPCAIAAKD